MPLRFLVDESTGVKVAGFMRDRGFDTLSVTEEMRGLPDSELLNRPVEERRILANKNSVLAKVLERYGEKLEGSLLVATEKKVRVRRL